MAAVLCRENKTSHELDIAVFGELPSGKEALLAIGEAKWNDVMSSAHLDRLIRIRQLLSRKYATTHTRLLCCSGAGFMPALAESAARNEVILAGWTISTAGSQYVHTTMQLCGQ